MIVEAIDRVLLAALVRSSHILRNQIVWVGPKGGVDDWVGKVLVERQLSEDVLSEALLSQQALIVELCLLFIWAAFGVTALLRAVHVRVCSR